MRRQLFVYFAQFLVLTAVALLFGLAQQNAGPLFNQGVTGLFVPDSQSLADTTKRFWSDPMAALAWKDVNTLFGVFLLYAPEVVLRSPFPTLLTNVALLWGTLALTARTLASLGVVRFRWVAPAVLLGLNVYVLAAAPFPNKEIPLLFLLSVFVHFIVVRPSAAMAVVTCVVVFLFRDGFALILLGYVVLWQIWLRNRRVALILAALALTMMIVVPLPLIAQLLPALARNSRLGAEIAAGKFDTLGPMAGYVARLLGNSLNFTIRPQLFDAAGNLYAISVGYWQLGWAALAGIAWSLMSISRTDQRGAVALLILTSLLALSYGTFVQPRYLMPLLPLFSLAILSSRTAVLVSTVACLAGPPLMSAMNLLPPPLAL